jgi:quercetin dioxygenase-like cupin family protein
MLRARRTSVLALAALAAGAALAVLLLASAFGDSKAEPTVTRSALAQSAKVQGAPGRELILSRVVVQPGAKLAPHHHLGSQVAHVESGVLRYTVLRGSVVVRRGESDERPRVVRKIAAGQTGSLRAGDWLVEQPSDIHEAANRGSKPVVIYLATLLKKGAPPATPVATTSTAP